MTAPASQLRTDPAALVRVHAWQSELLPHALPVAGTSKGSPGYVIRCRHCGAPQPQLLRLPLLRRRMDLL